MLGSNALNSMDSRDREGGFKAGKTQFQGPQLRLGDFAVDGGDQLTYTRRIVAMEVEKLKKIVMDLDNTTQNGSRVIGALQQHLLRIFDNTFRDLMA